LTEKKGKKKLDVAELALEKSCGKKRTNAKEKKLVSI